MRRCNPAAARQDPGWLRFARNDGRVVAPVDGPVGTKQGISRVEEGRGGLRDCQSPRFPSPLIKPDVRISRIRLSDRLHGRPTTAVSGVWRSWATPNFPLDFAPGKRACPSSGLLVPFGEEAANALGDITIDGPVGRSAGSVAEIGRPARKSAVQSAAHFRPRSLFARLQ